MMRRAAIALLALLAAAPLHAQQSITGITLTQEELQSLPLGRRISDVLLLAPGVDSGAFTGLSVFRSSFPALYADGLPANATLPVEFTETAAIHTGGIRVEYAGPVVDATFHNGRQRPHVTLFGYTTPSGLQNDRPDHKARASDFGATFGAANERLSFFGGVDRFRARTSSTAGSLAFTARGTVTAYLARLAAQATPHWTLVAELLGDPGRFESVVDSPPGGSGFDGRTGIHRTSLRASRTTAAWLIDASAGHSTAHDNDGAHNALDALRIAVEHPLAAQHIVHLGGETQRQSSRYEYVDSSVRIHQNDVALWIADAWQLRPSLTLTGGLRWWRGESEARSDGPMFDFDSRDHRTEIDPHLSLVWAAAAATRVSASVHEYSGQAPFAGIAAPAPASPSIDPQPVIEMIVRVERSFGAWRAGGFVIDQQHRDFRAIVGEAAYTGATGLRLHGSYLLGNRGFSDAARQLLEADGAYAFPARGANVELGAIVTASAGHRSTFLRRGNQARLDLHGGLAFRAATATPRLVVDIFNVTNNERVTESFTNFDGVDVAFVRQAPRSIRLGARVSF
jgi:hypothetical protein